MTLARISSLSLLLGTAFAVSCAAAADRQSAIVAAQREATAQGMPAGPFGVRWLESQATLRAARPNARPENQDTLSESVKMGEREATMTYLFRQDALLGFITTYEHPTSADVESAQADLQKKYGAMTPFSDVPGHAADSLRCSERTTGRFMLKHCTRQRAQEPVEQISVYRLPPK